MKILLVMGLDQTERFDTTMQRLNSLFQLSFNLTGKFGQLGVFNGRTLMR